MDQNQKIEKRRSISIVLVMGILLFGLSLSAICKEPEEFSYSERRVLATMPEIKKETILSGKFMTDFETYTLDQFPARDTFRSLKAIGALGLFRQKDNHDLYYAQGHLSKLMYPMAEGKISYGLGKLQKIYDTVLAKTDCQVYLSVIPDKNAFLAPDNHYLSVDYEAFIGFVLEKVPYASYIDIASLLSLEDFYLTDQHWKQENLIPVAEKLLKAMGALGEQSEKTEYEKITLDAPFYGAYYGQAALPVKTDQITYLTNDTLKNCQVTDYNTGSPAKGSVYDMEKASGRDPYEMFLMGATPLIEIVNPKGNPEKELVIFRDSFGSSLTPLLVESYGKITLVDIRYMSSSMVEKLITFDHQDVLLLYSTLVLNTSNSFR